MQATQPNSSNFQVLNCIAHCTDIHADRTTTIGKMIDSYLRSGQDLNDQVIHLLFSANRWEARYPYLLRCWMKLLMCSESLKASLLEGVNIVVDRYVYSGVAFSAAKVCHSVTQLRHYVNIWHRDLIILGVEIQM